MRGATGSNSRILNGTYVPTAERLNGKPVYAKEGDMERWLIFGPDKFWMASHTVNKAENGTDCVAYTELGLAHPGAARSWEVWRGDKWEPQQIELSFMVRRS